MAINNSQRCGFPAELSVSMTGAVNLIGTLMFNPVCIIFDNQSTSSVALSVNDPTGATVWRTFPAGEALTLDLRNQHGLAPNFTIDMGTSFYGTGTNLSGKFSISYVYAINT